jgi:hypothetical protein
MIELKLLSEETLASLRIEKSLKEKCDKELSDLKNTRGIK